MIAQALLVGLGAAGLAIVATVRVNRRLAAHGVVDVPNERSLHQKAVVRGAGLAAALVWIAIATVTEIAMGPSWSGIALILMVGCLTALGLLDDVWHLSPITRLLAQIVIAGTAVAGGLGSPALFLPGGSHVDLGILAWPTWTASIVVVVNFFNFMDGIDGLTAGQTLVSALCLAALGLALHSWAVAVLGAALAGAIAGFLPFNWQPARCFLGDAGSYFCGGCLVGLWLFGQPSGISPVIAALPAAAFFLDPLLTLTLRILRREAVWTPHRRHLYQRLVVRGWSHARVATGYLSLALLVSAVELAYTLPSSR